MAAKPKGGRGQREAYQTKQVRCPEPIKPTVDALIAIWHDKARPTLIDIAAASNPNTALLENLNTLLGDLQTQSINNSKLNTSIEELDAECNRLHERNGELELEVQNLREQISQRPAQCDHSTDLNPYEVLNKLKGLEKKSKATVKDVEAILKILTSSQK